MKKDKVLDGITIERFFERMQTLRSVSDEEDVDFGCTYLFYSEILPIVVGKHKCKHDICNIRISEWSTVHEEALAVWIIENNKEKWIKVLDKGRDADYETESETEESNMKEVVSETDTSSISTSSLSSFDSLPSSKKRKIMSSMKKKSKKKKKKKKRMGKYTCNITGASKYKSWSSEGIKKYNEIWRTIYKQRKSYNGKCFEDEFLETMILNKEMEDENNNKKKKSSDKRDIDEDIQIITGIGYDLSEEEEGLSLPYAQPLERLPVIITQPTNNDEDESSKLDEDEECKIKEEERMMEEQQKKAEEYIKKAEESLAMKEELEEKANSEFKKADDEAKKARSALRNAKAESTKKRRKLESNKASKKLDEAKKKAFEAKENATKAREALMKLKADNCIEKEAESKVMEV